MRNNIIAVVVTFNRKELLKEALIGLLNQSYNKLDILIVDNASTDGTKEYIADLLSEPQVFYLNTQKNIGGAGGFNVGMKYAVEKGYEYMWVMDDDTVPEVECLESLLKADKILEGKYGFLCSYVEWIDGNPAAMNLPSIPKNWGEDVRLMDYNLLRVKTASFVSFFVKSETVKKAGLPIKDFFIWGDDMEFSMRLSKKEPCYLVKDSKVIHKMKSNQSTNIYEEEGNRLDRYVLLYRNRFYFGRKNGFKEFLFYLCFVFESIVRIMRKAPDKKWKRIKLLLTGFIKGIFFFPKVEYPESSNL